MQRMLIVILAALSALATGRPVAAGVEVAIDGAKHYQTIDGFGTCLISWDAKMARFYQTPEAQRMFAEELRFNILRCNLWGDGTIGPTADPQKISCQDPAFAARDPRTPVFLNFAKAVQKLNPNLRVIGTVWSPPAWMKENGSITDKGSGAINGTTYQIKQAQCPNRVKPEYYPHFAKWLVEMTKFYQARGVPLAAVSAANEPQFTQGFESCVWTAKDLATVTGLVGDLLEKEGLKTRLFGPETMTGFNWPGGPNRAYLKEFKDNPAAWKALGFLATHGYADGVKADLSQNSSAQFWQLIADAGKPYWVTEGGTGKHRWPTPVSAGGVAAAIHNALVAGNASAFVPWQFAEDGDSEHAITATRELDKKGYTVRQFSHYIAPGAVRIDATPAYGEVNVSAYVHEASKTLTIVLINPGASEQAVTLTLRGTPAAAELATIRTSETESGQVLAPTAVRNGQVTLTVPGQAIVTLTNGK